MTMNNTGETVGSMMNELQDQFPKDASEKIETAKRELKETVSTIRDKSRDVVKRVKSEVDDRPYVAMGVCTGIGFALGAMFGSRPMRLILIGGLGYLVSRLPLGELFENLREGADQARDQSKSRSRSQKH